MLKSETLTHLTTFLCFLLRVQWEHSFQAGITLSSATDEPGNNKSLSEASFTFTHDRISNHSTQQTNLISSLRIFCVSILWASLSDVHGANFLKSGYTNHKLAALFSIGERQQASLLIKLMHDNPATSSCTHTKQDKNICLRPLHVIYQLCVTKLTAN